MDLTWKRDGAWSQLLCSRARWPTSETIIQKWNRNQAVWRDQVEAERSGCWAIRIWRHLKGVSYIWPITAFLNYHVLSLPLEFLSHRSLPLSLPRSFSLIASYPGHLILWTPPLFSIVSFQKYLWSITLPWNAVPLGVCGSSFFQIACGFCSLST